jgi:hypothetical protein
MGPGTSPPPIRRSRNGSGSNTGSRQRPAGLPTARNCLAFPCGSHGTGGAHSALCRVLLKSKPPSRRRSSALAGWGRLVRVGLRESRDSVHSTVGAVLTTKRPPASIPGQEASHLGQSCTTIAFPLRPSTLTGRPLQTAVDCGEKLVGSLARYPLPTSMTAQSVPVR